MKYTTLRGTGIEVSKVCLGTSPFGVQTSKEDAIKIVHHALDLGINFFDTADSYNNGASEACIGAALKGRRSEAVVATKVFFPVGEGRNNRGLNRTHIINAVNDSLRRLDTDYIDIYYMHAPDYQTPMEESLEAMTSLVRSGKVRYIGMSNYAAWQICKARWVTEKLCGIAPSVVECGYNLLSRSLEPELVPFLKEYSMGLVVYQPLAAGLLTGKYQYGQTVDSSVRLGRDMQHHDRYWSKQNFDAIEQLKAVASDAQISLAELALKWCAQHDFVDSVLVGVSRDEQMMRNVSAFEGDGLSADIMAECDRIWQQRTGNLFQYNR